MLKSILNLERFSVMIESAIVAEDDLASDVHYKAIVA